MNPTDCLEIATLIQDYKITKRIFELIENNYGHNVVKEPVPYLPVNYHVKNTP